MPLCDSPYSRHFNILAYHGGWNFYPTNPSKASVRAVFMLCFSICRLIGFIFCMVNFFRVFYDLEKLSWNVCVTSVYFGTCIKDIILYQNHRILDRLRRNLHKDMLASMDEEHSGIHMNALKDLIHYRMFFYVIPMTFTPVWIGIRYFSYLWGPRQFPLPVSLNEFPFTIDPESTEYIVLYFFLSFNGMVGILFIIEIELSTFTMFIQISREYNIYIMDLKKLNDIYSHRELNDEIIQNDIDDKNKFIKAKNLIKKFVKRQLKLIEYTKNFEYCFNYNMLLHIVAAAIIVTFNTLLCLKGSRNLSPDVSFQIGLLFLVFIEVFLTCRYAEKITSQCLKVGSTIYSLNWYDMPTVFHKDLKFMIMKSQSPPLLSCAKLMKINVNTFMVFLRNIFSWLTLLWQLDQNK